jgi:hypothetical protein
MRCHLELARLALAQKDNTGSRRDLTQAAALVAATGYHRRDKDLGS